MKNTFRMPLYQKTGCSYNWPDKSAPLNMTEK